MKTLFLFFMMLVTTLSAMAKGKSIERPDAKLGYVYANGNMYVCNQMQMGVSWVQIITPTGEKMKINSSEITMYSRKGKVYEKLPLYVNNKETDRMVFMELVSIRNGLKLYKYNDYSATLKNFKATTLSQYFVYQNGKLYVPVDVENYATILNFFHVNFSMV